MHDVPRQEVKQHSLLLLPLPILVLRLTQQRIKEVHSMPTLHLQLLEHADYIPCLNIQNMAKQRQLKQCIFLQNSLVHTIQKAVISTTETKPGRGKGQVQTGD